MKLYLLVFFFSIPMFLVCDTLYYVEIYEPKHNQANYAPSKIFKIEELHTEGIKEILKQEEKYYYDPNLYIVNLIKKTIPHQKIIIYNATFTLPSVHQLARYIPKVMAEYN